MEWIVEVLRMPPIVTKVIGPWAANSLSNDFKRLQSLWKRRRVAADRMETTVYLSLGSNVGDRKKHLHDAIARLQPCGRVLAVSSFYETEPVDFTRQAWFLNCAVAMATTLTPEQLMSDLLAIEKTMGRERTHHKGPRTIDIDILLFGDAILNTSRLTVPHPAMHRRRFVLDPLAEIAPGVRHPALNMSVRELLSQLPDGQIVRKI